MKKSIKYLAVIGIFVVAIASVIIFAKIADNSPKKSESLADFNFTPMGDGTFALTGYSGDKTEVVIPSSVDGIPVTMLSNNAFGGDSGITYVSIPASITRISGDPFHGCKTLKIVDIQDLSAWCDVSFGSYSSTTSSPLQGRELYVKGEKVTDLVIPEGVTHISSHAFYKCTGITSVTFPEGVLYIGDLAFSGCFKLSTVNFPSTLRIIGKSAFTNSALTSVNIPGGVSEINELAFSGTGIRELHLPDSVTKVGQSAFADCTSLSDVYIEGTGDTATLFDENAFLKCSVKRIHIDDISRWLSLEFASTLSSPMGINTSLMKGNETITALEIPSGTTAINAHAFRYCKNLTSVTIPVGVTSIGNSAFHGCEGLTNITIPEGITSIEPRAFSSCTSLKSVTFSGGINSIGNNAFDNCPKLDTVNVLDLASWCSVSFDSDWNNPLRRYGVKFLLNGEVPTELNIPEGVTSIGNYAFLGVGSSIEKLTLPEGLTSIGQGAFRGMSKITELYIPGSVKSIGDEAFYGCNALETLTLCEGLESIGKNAFAYARELKEINVPETVQRIYSGAFGECSAVEKLTIPFSGGENAPSAQPSLISLFGVTNATDYRFPSGLTEVHVTGNGVIPKNAFSGCTKITTITISSGITGIEERAFYGCTGLTSIVIPETVEFIGQNCFYGCSALKDVRFAEGSRLTNIDKYAFANCTSLASIALPASLLTINSYAFVSCPAFKNATFESPQNWYVTNSSGVSSAAPLDLSNTRTAATYLTSQYVNVLWEKKQ